MKLVIQTTNMYFSIPPRQKKNQVPSYTFARMMSIAKKPRFVILPVHWELLSAAGNHKNYDRSL